MLTHAQVDHFRTKGYLVVENLLDEKSLKAVRQEYADRMDELYVVWE